MSLTSSQNWIDLLPTVVAVAGIAFYTGLSVYLAVRCAPEVFRAALAGWSILLSFPPTAIARCAQLRPQFHLRSLIWVVVLSAIGCRLFGASIQSLFARATSPVAPSILPITQSQPCETEKHEPLIALLGYGYVPDPDNPLYFCKNCGLSLDEQTAMICFERLYGDASAARDK